MAADRPHDLDQQVQAGASGEIARLVAASALVVLLLAGGVYWLHHTPAGLPQHEAGTLVQVRLLPSPDPTPFPMAETEPSTDTATGQRAEQPLEPASEVRHEEVQPAPTISPTVAKPTTSVNPRLNQRSARSPASDLALKFQQALLRHIARFQRYPLWARQNGLKGTVQVLFLLRRDGTVLDAWVQSTSGEVGLDREAIETVRRAEPLPVIPTELPDQIRVLLPVDFALP
jgi:periplasmic protein TonB